MIFPLFDTVSDVEITGPNGRPMDVSIEYCGVLPPDAFPERTDFSKVTMDQIRAKCVSRIEGVDHPFRIEATSVKQACSLLTDHNVDAEICGEILRVVLDDDSAPKYRIVDINDDTRQRFIVCVSFADKDPRSKGEQLLNQVMGGNVSGVNNGFGNYG